MARPERIQLKRTKGWRKPPGAVVVSRPSVFGNPYRIAGPPVPREIARVAAVMEFSRDLRDAIDRPWAQPLPIEIRNIADRLGELRGRDLACWCPLDQPCHADVLLEIANAREEAPTDGPEVPEHVKAQVRASSNEVPREEAPTP